jgi:hypothetical protein
MCKVGHTLDESLKTGSPKRLFAVALFPAPVLPNTTTRCIFTGLEYGTKKIIIYLSSCSRFRIVITKRKLHVSLPYNRLRIQTGSRNGNVVRIFGLLENRVERGDIKDRRKKGNFGLFFAQ